MQQRHLIFLDLPCPQKDVWAQLDDAQRQAVVEILARLIARSACPERKQEERIDE